MITKAQEAEVVERPLWWTSSATRAREAEGTEKPICWTSSTTKAREAEVVERPIAEKQNDENQTLNN